MYTLDIFWKTGSSFHSQRWRTIGSSESYWLGDFYTTTLSWLLVHCLCVLLSGQKYQRLVKESRGGVVPLRKIQPVLLSWSCHWKRLLCHNVHHVMIPKATITCAATTLKAFHRSHLARLRHVLGTTWLPELMVVILDNAFDFTRCAAVHFRNVQ